MFYLLIMEKNRPNHGEKCTMPIKSSRDIATSLRGSAFRRVAYDGRNRMIREILTMGRVSRNVRRPVRPDRSRTQSAE
jgi:YD repeat-containing protein